MSESPLKDSGIDWIGQVPEGWEVSRVGTHFSIQLGKMLSPKQSSTHETLEKYICAANVHYDGVSGEKKEMWFSTAEKDAYRIKVGDMLVVEGGAGAGGCAVVEKLDGDTYFQNSILRLRGECFTCNRYLCYWFQQLGQRGYVAYACNVATIPHFTKEKMRQVPMPVPPLHVQQAIVAYLDEKTAAIDARVAVLEKKLAAYKRLKASVINRAVTRGLDPKAKLKDSGVDWIGKVPVGWEVVHLKRLTKKIGSGKTPSGGAEIYSTEGVMFLRSQNVYDEGLLLDDVAFISHEIDSEMASTRVFYGDVLLNITGGSIGRCCVYAKHEHANVNQHVCIIRADVNHAHNTYIKYFWNTLGQEYLRLSQLGGNRESLNFEQIGNAPFPCPRISEQRAIADYLDAECAKIDKVVEIIAKQIDAYKRLKRSLINEVVTGKRKVA